MCMYAFSLLPSYDMKVQSRGGNPFFPTSCLSSFALQMKRLKKEGSAQVTSSAEVYKLESHHETCSDYPVLCPHGCEVTLSHLAQKSTIASICLPVITGMTTSN